MNRFLKKLNLLNENDIYPFHMPGHKRNIKFLDFENPASFDITEIDGYDNLHNPTGMILDLQSRISKKSNSIESLISVNGSTACILSTISGICSKGDKIIVARNCHKSVYNACLLNELNTVYIEPNYDELGFYTDINLDSIKMIIESNTDAKLVVITSPTYEGVISDIKSIAKLCHMYGISLFVDEAHGAHLSYSNYFGESAINFGADVVSQSYHKTLPCFTQTAVLHICSNKIDIDSIKKYMRIYQSSSPSYVLMASEEVPLNLSNKEFENHYNMIKNFYSSTKLNNLSFYVGKNVFGFDKSKIIIVTNGTNMTGEDLSKILLEKYNIQLEMSSQNYAIAMTSVCDTETGFKRLSEAIVLIDNNLVKAKTNEINKPKLPKISKKICLTHGTDYCNLSDSVGKISAEFVYAYPPGIPIIVPGEVINSETKNYIMQCLKYNVNIISDEGKLPNSIRIDNR